MLNLRLKEGYFPIPLWLHRDHLEKLGYDINELTDGDMEYLAQRIADDFFAQHYAQALRETAECYMKYKKSHRCSATIQES